MTVKIGILGSKRGTDMQAIIDAIENKQLDAQIEIVISDKKEAGILEKARTHNISAEFVNPKEFESRVDFDHKIGEILENHSVKLVFLIGYDKIVGTALVQQFQGRMLNIHPSLLPAFANGFDTKVHERVLKAGVTESGCTLHLVTDDIDEGPIIKQKKVPVSENDTIETLKNKVQKAEQEVILETLKEFSEKGVLQEQVKE